MKFYAHSMDHKLVDEWHLLEEHLKGTAELAAKFAAEFGCAEWGRLAGLWHDLGKYSEDFQKMLLASADAHIETKPGRVDHSTAGAQRAVQLLGNKGKLLAYTIAGHHSGLPNGKANEQLCLIERLEKKIPDYSSCLDHLSKCDRLSEPPFTYDKNRFAIQLSFFIRMIYSCLVDADFLDTEKFMDRETYEQREGYPALSDLYTILSSALDEVTTKDTTKPINKERTYILTHCINAANSSKGLFSLTVPTGGGKTLSSMAFAINHAIKHKMDRIIYVIPYTSIIEQNADVFRKIFGNNAVLEHHSNCDPDEEDRRSRLASENWDAPIVVTTNVQFFESLFGSRSSRCRKIHNIANSVVILDEAQMLPVPLLKPCIEALRELSLVYKTTVVLCTATQPALSTTNTFKNGLDNVREIIPDPDRLYNADAFKRIKIKNLSSVADGELAEKMKEVKQSLCIVNTRKHARQLFEQIKKEQEGCFHLSASMCPVHRTEKLKQIRERLEQGLSCKLISTQLIEAGVDIDFPVVFRAAAGIDSIAQAAGRCNREGKLPDSGQVYIFHPENGLPPGHFRQTADIAETVMRHHDDILSISAVKEYFTELFWTKGETMLDQYEILKDLKEDAARFNFPFKDVDRKFSVIKDAKEPIIIPWNKEARNIIQSLRYAEYTRSLARKAQRYTVQVHPQVLLSLLNAGSVEKIKEQYNVLINEDLYRDDIGLCPDNPVFHEVENLII